ncbi:hypothetical protein [Dapis sp. BLCC M229]|uniref:hypothetical protein n=1 Tax=Dapis sp. BLCC M229 TaxID=3400188 RepID=UPI003CE6D977
MWASGQCGFNKLYDPSIWRKTREDTVTSIGFGIWVHTRKENTAAQRAGLALAEPSGSYIAPWNWNDLITYPTLC